MAGLIVYCYAGFSGYPWRACSFLKGNREAMGLGEREGRGKKRRDFGWDILYGRKIKREKRKSTFMLKFQAKTKNEILVM